MFQKNKLPKIYCKISIHDESIDVSFFGLLGFKTVNNFPEIDEEVKQIGINKYQVDLYGLDSIYHFLANDNFIPVSETFFYREAEKKDQLQTD